MDYIVMCVKDERNERQRKDYRTPSMTIYVMRRNINLLAGSPTPGAGGDPTPGPDDE